MGLSHIGLQLFGIWLNKWMFVGTLLLQYALFTEALLAFLAIPEALLDSSIAPTAGYFGSCSFIAFLIALSKQLSFALSVTFEVFCGS